MNDLKFEAVKKIAETKFKYKDFGKISDLNTTSPPSVFIGSGTGSNTAPMNQR